MMPSIVQLVRLGLIDKWTLRSASFFSIQKLFQERIDTVRSKDKSFAYHALKIVSFMMSHKKALMDQGY